MADLNDLSTTVVNAAKDAIYIGVGLGVLTYQRLAVQRQELRKLVTEALGKGSAPMSDLVKSLEAQLKTVETQLKALEQRVEAVLDSVEAKLPTAAADALAQARSVARSARNQVLDLVPKPQSSAA